MQSLADKRDNTSWKSLEGCSDATYVCCFRVWKAVVNRHTCVGMRVSVYVCLCMYMYVCLYLVAICCFYFVRKWSTIFLTIFPYTYPPKWYNYFHCLQNNYWKRRESIKQCSSHFLFVSVINRPLVVARILSQIFLHKPMNASHMNFL